MHKIKYFIQQSWLLIVASFLFGLLIAVADAQWEPKIKQNEVDKLNGLMKSLINDADQFKIIIDKTPIKMPSGKVFLTDIYQAADSAGNGKGYAFVAEGSGFADKIKLVIALDNSCREFLGFKVLSSNETPGFGSKIKDKFFQDQFIKAPAGQITLMKTGDSEKIDSQIVAISGATVSSDAVVRIFNSYVDAVKEDIKDKTTGAEK